MGTGVANVAGMPQTSRPQLTATQKDLIVAATAELVNATVLGRPPVLPDPRLSGASDAIVSGAFVSLKRHGTLRSCCGMLGQPLPLGLALQDATVRTAREDVRFPPVSPTELPYLDLEVWLLYAPQRVKAQGTDRIAAVTIGRHGLQVVRGDARGLLLPGVALDLNLDSEGFLQQVCLKAGLHPTAWKDDATTLLTFEGESLHGTLNASGVPGQAPLFTPQEVTGYAEFCRGNLTAMLRGATPSYYFMGARDCNVAGVIVTVPRDGQEPLHFSQFSLRPGVPLQATLFSLTQAAARSIAASPVSNPVIELTILDDPAMHGTAADPDLAGIDPQARAVLITERNKSGFVFNPRLTVVELVETARQQAQVSNPAGAPVFSVGTLTTADALSISTAPRAVRGPAQRPPGVAGMFYPADPAELSRMVDGLLANGSPRAPAAWPAAMLPHAGLIYSGRIAATVLKRLQLPETIIVIGPKHTPLGVEWAVAPQETWTLPGSTIASDPKLARQLTRAIAGLELDAAAHQREHAIEVELPLIARLAPQARVVGIAIGSGDLESCQRFAEGLVAVLRERTDRPLLLISSDMNHFATDAENRRLDELALAAMETLNPAHLLETCQRHRISMCGVLPAVIVMESLKRLGGLTKCERVGYATTADVTGDKGRVVGYAGMLLG
jgi:AmmeMemoRadiSam system protein B/AmmeMemoRadiSam system protein A